MATFRNRHGKWQARVQRKGQQPVSKSFQSKDDATAKCSIKRYRHEADPLWDIYS